jgi:ATP/ADP translocase
VLGSPAAAYPASVAFARALVAVTALVVGVPLLIVGLALIGPVGWIAAAVVLPLATLVVILWLGRERPGDGPPRGG